jgi:transposase
MTSINGTAEGQFNRLKMPKRQICGRAGFGLTGASALPFNSRTFSS